jgi:PPOX class probable F420-dependent enzyme
MLAITVGSMELTEALTFVKARKNGVLTTIRANGRPQLSNIFYVPGDDGVLRISITDTRAKTANMRRDPRVSLYVPGDNFFQYVVLEATAELTPVAADPHDDTVDQLVAYYRAGNGEHENWDDYRSAMVADQRLILSLRAERAYGMVMA